MENRLRTWSWQRMYTGRLGMWLEFEAMQLERNAWVKLNWEGTILKTCEDVRIYMWKVKERKKPTPRLLV